MPWSSGRYIAWDFTCPDTLAPIFTSTQLSRTRVLSPMKQWLRRCRNMAVTGILPDPFIAIWKLWAHSGWSECVHTSTWSPVFSYRRVMSYWSPVPETQCGLPAWKCNLCFGQLKLSFRLPKHRHHLSLIVSHTFELFVNSKFTAILHCNPFDDNNIIICFIKK